MFLSRSKHHLEVQSSPNKTDQDLHYQYETVFRSLFHNLLLYSVNAQVDNVI